MQSEDMIHLPAVSNDSGSQGDNAELCNSSGEPCDADSQQKNLEVKENKLDVDNAELCSSNGEPFSVDSRQKKIEVKEDTLDVEISGTADADDVRAGNKVLPTAELDRDFMESSSVIEVTVGVKEVSSVAEYDNCLDSAMLSENGCIKERNPITGEKREGSSVSNSLSGIKKARTMVDEQQPSVRVMFNFLTRDSKRKLEELLQNWSEWNAKHPSSSPGSMEGLESGEQTYFPALRVGLSDSTSVSVWMDNHSGCQHYKEITPLDSKSVPLYDRGYSWALTSSDISSNLEGGLEKMDSSRCFNCGAYDHALKECPKPRDIAAVNNARKEHNSKRNLNANSRNPTRYYQNSSGGKYDGLKPGSLDAETRKLLGLGELDPPPWLNRMREIGYPQGYLDPGDEDQPSGILIFGDEEHKEEKETEDGEILDTDFPELPRTMSSEPPRKMSVQFPGINAPIPENASESRWSTSPSSSDFHMNRSHQRANHFSVRNTFNDQRWSRDIKNGHSTSRYGDLDSSYSFQRERGIIFASPVNPSLERSFSERGRWSPSADNSPHHRSYGSRIWEDDRRNDFDSNYSSRHRDRDRDRDDNHHPYRRR